jgi:ribonuclease P protein component
MQRFTKTQRVLSKSDFEANLNGSGLKVVCRDFVFVASRSAHSGPARLGLVVSGKVGNSVVRNKVKRSIREVFRTDLCKRPEFLGRDLIVIARPSLMAKDSAEGVDIQGSVRHCASKLSRKLESGT